MEWAVFLIAGLCLFLYVARRPIMPGAVPLVRLNSHHLSVDGNSVVGGPFGEGLRPYVLITALFHHAASSHVINNTLTATLPRPSVSAVALPRTEWRPWLRLPSRWTTPLAAGCFVRLGQARCCCYGPPSFSTISTASTWLNCRPIGCGWGALVWRAQSRAAPCSPHWPPGRAPVRHNFSSFTSLSAVCHSHSSTGSPPGRVRRPTMVCMMTTSPPVELPIRTRHAHAHAHRCRARPCGLAH
mmetsp:Transcript_106989/g.310676  ORF Transcript_106989/g.310676 Transcript_106989/m.310676 type:complete len:242 (-) Transcript_106989:982-1707(-)